MKKLVKFLALALAIACCFTACGESTSNGGEKMQFRDYETVLKEIQKEKLDKIDHRLFNFTQPYTAKGATAEKKATMRRAKIMLMGDSFTAGDGNNYAEHFYTNLTDLGGYFELVGINKYKNDRLKEPFNRNTAGGGWTVSSLKNAYKKVEGGKIAYDIAIINIGLNNGYGNIEPADYQKQYDELIAQIYADRPDAILYLSSICKGELTDQYTDKLSACVEAIVNKYAKTGKKIYYVNLDEYFDMRPDLNYIMVGPGNGHPNHIGHYKMGAAYAQSVINDVKAINAKDALPSDEAIVEADGIKLNKKDISLKINEQKILAWKLYPEENSTPCAIFTSSDPFVATVDHYGVVTAIGKGNAKITARIPGTETTAECIVKVTDEEFTLTPAGKNEIFSETFSTIGQWTGTTERIADGFVKIKYDASAINLTSENTVKAKKTDASMSFDLRTSALIGQDSKASSLTVSWGEYKIITYNNWKETYLYYGDKLLGSHLGMSHAAYLDKFTLNFKDGNVYLYMNNALAIKAEAPADPEGKLQIWLKRATSCGFYLDNLIIKG